MSAPHAAPAAGGSGALNTLKGWGDTAMLKGRILGGKLGTVGKVIFWPYTAIMSAPRKLLFAGIGKGFEYGKKGAYVGREAIAGIVGKGAIGSGLTLANTVYTDIKMNLWDIPREMIKGIVPTAINTVKSPLNFAKGVRKSISTVFNAPGKLLDHALKLDIRGLMKETRDTLKNTFLPPITEPLMPLLATPKNIGKIALGSKLQYYTGYRNFYKAWGNGINHTRGAITTGLARYEHNKSEAVKALEAKRAHEKEAHKAGEAHAVEKAHDAKGAKHEDHGDHGKAAVHAPAAGGHDDHGKGHH